MTQRAPGWRIALWAAAWLFAGALLWLVSRGADWGGAAVAARGARAPWLAAAIAANLGILLLWAALWRLVLPRDVVVPYGRMFGIAAVTSAIMNTIPALVGHASAVALLVKRGPMPVRTAGAVMTLDQLGEGLSKLAVLAVAVWVIDLPPWMVRAGATVGLVVLALLAAILLVGIFGRMHLGDSRLARLLDAVRADLHVVRSPVRALGAVAIALAMKAAEAAAIAAVIVALGLDVPIGAAFVVLGAVNLATMLPVAPGNLGTYEAGAVAAYRWLGVAPESALAAAVVQHACFLLPAGGAGVVGLMAGRLVSGERLVVRGHAADP